MSIYDYDDALFPGEGSLTLRFAFRAMEAARRSSQDGKVRMNYAENAIRRALAEVGIVTRQRCIGWRPLSGSSFPWFAWHRYGGSWTPSEPWIAEAPPSSISQPGSRGFANYGSGLVRGHSDRLFLQRVAWHYARRRRPNWKTSPVIWRTESR